MVIDGTYRYLLQLKRITHQTRIIPINCDSKNGQQLISKSSPSNGCIPRPESRAIKINQVVVSGTTCITLPRAIDLSDGAPRPQKVTPHRVPR